MRTKKDDPNRCEQHVTDHTGFGYPQCSRQWRVDDNGHWCKVHSPKAVAARQKKSHDWYEAQDAERRRPFDEAKRMAKANEELLEALKKSASRLHGLTDEPVCQRNLFDECTTLYCIEARDAIAAAEGS